MENDKTKKVLHYSISALAVTAVSAIVILVFVGSVCLARIVNTAQNMLDTTMEKASYLQQAEVSFTKIQLTLAGYVSHRDPVAAQEEAVADMASFSNQLLSVSERLYQLSQMEGFAEESDLTQRLITRLHFYLDFASEITNAAAVNDTAQIEALFVEASPLGDECAGILQHLTNLYQHQAADSYYLLQNRSIVTLVILCVLAAIFVIILLALRLSIAARFRQAESEAVQQLDSNYPLSPNTNTNINTNQTSSLPADASRAMLVEFDKRLSELKAVAYDLTRLTKERSGK